MNKDLVSGFLLFAFSALFSLQTNGQQLLSLEEAIHITLKNNYDVRLFSNISTIEANNATLANAGFIPSLTGDLNNNNSIQDSRQVRSTGEITERNDAKSSSLNYGLNLRWTIFDGFAMFSRIRQLEEIKRLSEANLQETILTKVNEVYTIYFDLVQQQQQLKALESTLDISRYRVQNALTRFELGRAAKLEVLNTEVDFNTDTTSWLRQRQQYENTQTRLNELLARDVKLRFTVSDSIEIDRSLRLDSLEQWSAAQNPTLKAAVLESNIVALEYKRIRGNRYPSILLSTGYNFNRSQSALGFATQTSGQGITYGVTASVNIFNGFLQNRMEKNAKILIDNAEIQKEKINQNILTQLSTAYQSYTTTLSLVGLEEKNVQKARQNLEITLEKFRLGSITNLEMREAQINHINSQVRFSQVQYEAKMAEIALRMLAGKLSF